MTTHGQAGTGYATNFTPDIPRPTNTPTTHRPWCRTCKRTLNPDQLDPNSHCAPCATAAHTRATKQATTTAPAAAPPKPPKPSKPRKPAKPSPPVEIHATSSHSEATNEAPAKGHPPATPTPTPDPSDLELQAEISHITQLLTQTHNDPRPAIRTLRRALNQTIEALHLLTELHYPHPHTSAAGTGKGKPTPAADPTPKTPRTRPSRLDPHAHDVITAYQTGTTLATLATRYHMTPEGIRYWLHRQGIPTRPPGGNHGNQHTRKHTNTNQ